MFLFVVHNEVKWNYDFNNSFIAITYFPKQLPDYCMYFNISLMTVHLRHGKRYLVYKFDLYAYH